MIRGNKDPHCCNCGAKTRWAKRIYKEGRYCSKCYYREFTSNQCPTCGKTARILATDKEAECRSCERSKPCVRCGKSSFRIGKMSKYGPVCVSCAKYFRKPGRCEVCEKPSRILVTVNRIDGGIKRRCASCAREDFASCKSCGRYRLLKKTSEGDFCQKCLVQGYVSCETCGALMPAGFGKTCEQCYWARTLNERLRKQSNELESRYYINLLRDFGDWLLENSDPKSAALALKKYMFYFREMERSWSRMPDYKSLLLHFTADGLRRAGKLARWLSDNQSIVVNPSMREECSEKRRISESMQKVKQNSIQFRILEDYLCKLQTKQRRGSTSIRSVRLAMTAARDLLLTSMTLGKEFPSQCSIDQYLSMKPGQAAALSGFVNFLNSQNHKKVNLTIDKGRANAIRRRDIEKQLIAIMRDENASDENQSWLKLSLEYYHGVRTNKSYATLLKNCTRNEKDNSLVLRLNQTKYFLPNSDFCLFKAPNLDDR